MSKLDKTTINSQPIKGFEPSKRQLPLQTKEMQSILPPTNQILDLFKRLKVIHKLVRFDK